MVARAERWGKKRDNYTPFLKWPRRLIREVVAVDVTLRDGD